MRVVEGHRCTGEQAAPWEQGTMIWQSLPDILKLLGEEEWIGAPAGLPQPPSGGLQNPLRR
jgi:hypothetical protein